MNLVKLGNILLALPVLALCFSFGCGKTSENATAPAESAATQPATATVAPEVTESLRETDAALKAKEYEKAAAALMRMQMSGRAMTADESTAYSGKMRDLQSQLAEAASRGDAQAQAQAAIQMLRQSRSQR
ncbi:MAG: hypothetical protein FJ403_10470 [Verrucomicrobia bacterium]|nr:hypothetical protein [Verrucomicrobiota bacterium]